MRQTAAAPDFDPQSASGSTLIDRCCTINCWVGPDDWIVEGRQSMHLPSGDLVSLRPTGPVHLVDQEYEGYMGNYGGEPVVLRWRGSDTRRVAGLPVLTETIPE